MQISLALFCIGSLNTGEQGQPLATELAYDTACKKVLKGASVISRLRRKLVQEYDLLQSLF